MEPKFEIKACGEAWVAFDEFGSSIDGPSFLEIFFPDGHQCEVLNYGQGEGQINIDGREWGFYVNSEKNYSMVYHDAHPIGAGELHSLAKEVCEKLTRATGYDFYL